MLSAEPLFSLFFVPPVLIPSLPYVVRTHRRGAAAAWARFDDIPPIIAGPGIQTVALDLGDLLPNGETLIGIPSLSIAVDSGTDLTPSACILVVPQISTIAIALGGTGINDAALMFKLGHLQPGCYYRLQAQCNDSSGDTLVVVTHVYGSNPT